MNMILKLGAGALIVGTAITAAGCSNTGASTHTADAATAGAQPAHSAPSIPPYQNTDDKIPRINVAEAKKLIAEGKAVIIDVRSEDTYKMSHIKGASNVPLSKLQAGDFKDLPKDKLIIAYCG
ncbi:MAG TPA: rhodanese-like domain-containing protein [Blastocatellia bacterium]|nr:rhodanese-like domain-containing protein [Blastocatellia bacterium]